MCAIVGKVALLTHVCLLLLLFIIFFVIFNLQLIYFIIYFFSVCFVIFFSFSWCGFVGLFIIIIVIIIRFIIGRLNGWIVFGRHVCHIAIPTHSTDLCTPVECHESLTSTGAISMPLCFLLKWIVRPTSMRVSMTYTIFFVVFVIAVLLSLILLITCGTSTLLFLLLIIIIIIITIIIVNFTKGKFIFVLTWSLRVTWNTTFFICVKLAFIYLFCLHALFLVFIVVQWGLLLLLLLLLKILILLLFFVFLITALTLYTFITHYLLVILKAVRVVVAVLRGVTLDKRIHDIVLQILCDIGQDRFIGLIMAI